MSSEWLTLRTFDTPVLAELAKLHLAEAGIDCRLLNTEIVGMNPLWGNAVGNIPLQVQDKDRNAAEEVLANIAQANAMDEEAFAEAEFSDEDPSSADLISMEQLSQWRRPVILMFFIPLAFFLILAALGTIRLAYSLLFL